MVRCYMGKHVLLIYLFMTFAILTRARQSLLCLMKMPTSLRGFAAVALPNAGLSAVMPEQVLEIIELASTYHLTELSVSRDMFFPALGGHNFYLEQRLVEGLWPKHIVPNSPNRIMLANVPAPPRCELIALKRQVKYAVCN